MHPKIIFLIYKYLFEYWLLEYMQVCKWTCQASPWGIHQSCSVHGLWQLGCVLVCAVINQQNAYICYIYFKKVVKKRNLENVPDIQVSLNESHLLRNPSNFLWCHYSPYFNMSVQLVSSFPFPLTMSGFSCTHEIHACKKSLSWAYFLSPQSQVE